MYRYKLVLGGTVAGVAGVLAFPITSTHLTVPSASSRATGGSTSATTPTSTSPTTTAPTPSSSTPTTTPTTRSATSADQTFRYGDLAVKVTVSGSKITNVELTTLNENDDRSARIDNYAVPQLERQVISADSVNVDGVSGATFTSQAFIDAVANALGKLGIS
ncbi:MAG TPA: FMN-binding protein, partial [Acidimicrobiales bacterium]|nr:FMN-binding protein [Acidimicrobiales bacterium]